MDEIVTPCVGVCRLDPAGAACVGCGRTLNEIAMWTRFSDKERRDVMERLSSAARRARALSSHGTAERRAQ